MHFIAVFREVKVLRVVLTVENDPTHVIVNHAVLLLLKNWPHDESTNKS